MFFFLIPASREKYSDAEDSSGTLNNSPTPTDSKRQTPNSVSSPSQTEPTKPQKPTKNFLPPQTDTKIMVVWLESLEDSANFPICKASFFFKLLLILMNFLRFYSWSSFLHWNGSRTFPNSASLRRLCDFLTKPRKRPT